MSRYRVKAFFMHEHEAQAARRAVESFVVVDPEWTEGYLVGVVDESAIQDLTRQGLLITPIERVEAPTPTPTRTRRGAGAASRPTSSYESDRGTALAVPSAITGKEAAKKILSPRQASAQFYVVRLHGPLTEARRQGLQQHGISLLESLSSLSLIHI